MNPSHPLARLRHHVTGAIELGECEAVACVPALRRLSLTETASKTYGKSRYYAGSRRIGREAYRDIKNASDLDSLCATTRGGVRRFHCVARISPTVLRSICPTL